MVDMVDIRSANLSYIAIEDGHRNCVSVPSYEMVMFHGYVYIYIYNCLPEGNTWRNKSAWDKSWETMRENHLFFDGVIFYIKWGYNWIILFGI